MSHTPVTRASVTGIIASELLPHAARIGHVRVAPTDVLGPSLRSRRLREHDAISRTDSELCACAHEVTHGGRHS